MSEPKVMSTRKSARQAAMTGRADHQNDDSPPCVIESPIPTIYKYVDVGLKEYTKIIFKELKQIHERVERAQNNLVAMQSQIELMELC